MDLSNKDAIESNSNKIKFVSRKKESIKCATAMRSTGKPSMDTTKSNPKRYKRLFQESSEQCGSASFNGKLHSNEHINTSTKHEPTNQPNSATPKKPITILLYTTTHTHTHPKTKNQTRPKKRRSSAEKCYKSAQETQVDGRGGGGVHPTPTLFRSSKSIKRKHDTHSVQLTVFRTIIFVQLRDKFKTAREG